VIAHPIAVTLTDTIATICALAGVVLIRIAIGVGTFVLTVTVNDKHTIATTRYRYALIVTIEVRRKKPAVVVVNMDVLEPLAFVPTTAVLIAFFSEPRFEHIVTA
jgi:hypothetical protein